MARGGGGVSASRTENSPGLEEMLKTMSMKNLTCGLKTGCFTHQRPHTNRPSLSCNVPLSQAGVNVRQPPEEEPEQVKAAAVRLRGRF